MTVSSQAGQNSPLAMETVEQFGQENGPLLVRVKRILADSVELTLFMSPKSLVIRCVVNCVNFDNCIGWLPKRIEMQKPYKIIFQVKIEITDFWIVFLQCIPQANIQMT